MNKKKVEMGLWVTPKRRSLQTQMRLKMKMMTTRKGVEGLIDTGDPNRVEQTTEKVTQLGLDEPKELSKRE
ncbi:hypothetical protein STEG23_029984 [Scotinomys teguina]